MPITQKDLFNQNFWWEGKERIKEDSKIQDWEKSKIKWVPKQVLEFKKEPGIFILRGPRQVGKSTCLKLIIQDLLKKHNPKSIFFFDCEALYDFKELKETIEEYFKFLEIINLKEKTFIFLDEVTSVENWAKAIKFLADQGVFKNTRLFITGSNSLDLKRGGERMPGRLEKEEKFYPLNFREFVKLADLDLFKKFEKVKLENFGKKEIWLKAKKIFFLKEKLNKLLESYFLCNGFPYIINEFLTNHFISAKTYEIYLSSLRGEIGKHKKSEKKGMQILAELSEVLSSKIGFDTIAKKIVLSHHTVEEYFDFFEDLFFGKILYQIDLSKKKENFRKSKKFYFLDNIYFFLSRAIKEKWGDFFSKSLEFLSSEKKGYLAEQITFNHLCRFEKIGLNFWSNSSEIDFILSFNKKFFPIELKFQEKIQRQDFLRFKRLNFKEGLILSKNSYCEEENFIVLPLVCFLALLE